MFNSVIGKKHNYISSKDFKIAAHKQVLVNHQQHISAFSCKYIFAVLDNNDLFTKDKNYDIEQTQCTHDAMVTSLIHQSNVTTLFNSIGCYEMECDVIV